VKKIQNQKQRVLVNVILDKSGSMASKTQDVVEGFNAYLTGLAEEDQVDYCLSLTLFDTEVHHRGVAVPLSKVELLSGDLYRPGGNTALNDAIGATVRKVEADWPRVGKVVTVIMTDGEENSSREWTVAGIRALIEQKEKDGWTFVFMGASPGAWSQGVSYGVRKANVAQYDTSQYKEAFKCVAQGTNSIASQPTSRFENLFASVSETVMRKAGLRQSSDKD
jgi:uncharacterized protein with von Willebrand factor type A (vWA) domain